MAVAHHEHGVSRVLDAWVVLKGCRVGHRLGGHSYGLLGW